MPLPKFLRKRKMERQFMQEGLLPAVQKSLKQRYKESSVIKGQRAVYGFIDELLPVKKQKGGRKGKRKGKAFGRIPDRSLGGGGFF